MMEPLQLGLLAMLFISIVGGVLGVNAVLSRRTAMRQRLTRVAGSEADFAGSVDAESQSKLVRMAAPVARIATPDDEEEITRFRAKFYNAGIRSRAAPLYFFAVKALLALGLPVLIWITIQASNSRMSGQVAMMLMVLAAGLGYYLPNLVLGTWVRRRQRELFEAFPDAIDLMVVCIEAGLSLDMAIQRTSKEMEIRSKALAEELGLVGVELRIGATRMRALRNLAARTGVEEIQLFVAMLLQADRFGTSIADSMRIHAEDLRLRRQLRAEEMATKLPTKLLFPLMLTIFPSILVVLLGPAAIGIARQIFPLLNRM